MTSGRRTRWGLSKPTHRRESLGVHGAWLLAAAVLLAWGFFVAGHRSIPWTPQRCVFLAATGYPCPFCGGSRSFHAMARGRISLAFLTNPLAAGSYLIVLGVLLVNAIVILSRRRLRLVPPRPIPLLYRRLLWLLALTLLIANWIYLVMTLAAK